MTWHGQPARTCIKRVLTTNSTTINRNRPDLPVCWLRIDQPWTGTVQSPAQLARPARMASTSCNACSHLVYTIITGSSKYKYLALLLNITHSLHKLITALCFVILISSCTFNLRIFIDIRCTFCGIS